MAEAPKKPPVNPWLIAVVVSMATFMEVLDTSIANVALRYIAGSLAAGLDESTWVLTSYLVSNAIILPLSGWLSERVGRKKFYMTCVALFTISSFFCGIAPSLSFLLIARVIQGAGGGGLAPQRAGDPHRHFPSCSTWGRVRALRHRRRRRTRHRADPRRLHHRRVQLALDLLHQHPRRHRLDDPDAPPRPA